MRIQLQLTIVLLITSIFLISLVSIITYSRVKKNIQRQFIDHLEAISEIKEIRLHHIIEKNYEMANLLSNNDAIVSNVGNYLKVPGKEYQEAMLLPLNRFKKHVNSFRNLHIALMNGTVITSTDSTFIGNDFSNEETFIAAQNKRNYLDGFFYNQLGELNLSLSSPIYEDDRIIGVLIIDLNASEIISVTNDYTGLGETGETMMAKKYSDNFYITPLRFDANSALKTIIPPNDTNDVMNQALSKKEGIILDRKDYRGKQVIASTRFIEESEWGIVTKIDFEEAYEPVRKIKNILIWINFCALLAAIAIAYFLGIYLARPIKQLIHSTNKIKEGNFSERVNIPFNNELEILANSFNEMAENIENKMDELKRHGYVLSHDLKAPLHSMTSLLTFIQEEQMLSTEGKDMLIMCFGRIKQMEGLINELLKSSHEEKKIKETIDLNSLVNQVVALFNIPSHIHIFIQHNLPKVNYHRISLIQIFENLIGNSLKYIDKPDGVIKISCIEEEYDFKIGLMDNGPEIKAEDFEKIFGSSDLSHYNEQAENSGTFLFIVKQNIEGNRGKIWLESSEEGNTFYFTIPKD